MRNTSSKSGQSGNSGKSSPGARSVLTALVIIVCATVARADVVLDWNDHLLDSIRALRNDPPMATRFMAMTHVAVFDAVNGIAGLYQPYHVTDAAPAGASLEAAAAAAAHRVLVVLYPSRQAILDADLAVSLGAIPDGAAKDSGVAWGVLCADAILALRADDGASAVVTYAPPVGATWWLPTPPAFAPPLRPPWPQVAPWAMHSGSQFRAPGPPVTPSALAYTNAYYEVLRFGRATESNRTPDQSETALFWNDGPGTSTPPGHWHLIARHLAVQQGNSVVENARLFALLSITVADASIGSWDNKYHFHHWRPCTAITSAAVDGNPATPADSAWTSFITTPPFPSYTSGHSTYSSSSSRLIGNFFGDDELPFAIGSDGLPGVARNFTSLSQAAEEAGQSRIYGGIHWQYDNRDAQAAGRALADFVFANLLRPLGEPAETCAPSDTVLCLASGRFAVDVDWRTSAVTSPDTTGAGHAQSLTDSSGQFWFFTEDNVELLVKVLDGCGLNQRFWVLASGATDVELILRVRDLELQETRTYFNPLGHLGAAVADTEAFAGCP